MATVTITMTAGSEAGALVRRLAKKLEQAAAVLPDRNSTGASVVLTIDNNPASGIASVAITGPYTSGTILV